MDIDALKVGGKFPPMKNAGECVAISADESGIMLVYNFIRPTPSEIKATSADQPFEIAFVTVSNVLYVLSKCGNLNWTDAPFSPHLSRADRLQKIENDKDGYALTLMMVDAATNTIKSLRLIGLENKFSKELKREMDRLLELPFDAKSHDFAIRMINATYSTDALVKKAVHRWKLVPKA